MNIFQLEERVKENPDSPLITRLAAQYLIRGKISDAVKLLLRCINLCPDYSTSYLILARCYASQKLYSEALLCSEKVFSLQPDSLILKNLIRNWENSSRINADVEPDASSSLPDLNTLRNIIFNRVEPVMPQAEAQMVQMHEVIEPEKESDTKQIVDHIVEFDQNIKSENQNELSIIDSMDGSQTIVEFVDKESTKLPQDIEAVVKSIDLETENDLIEKQSIKETIFSENNVEATQEPGELIEKKIEDNITESERFPGQKLDDELSQTTETISSIISENIVSPQPVEMQTSQIVDSQQGVLDLDHTKTDIVEAGKIKKSDEHITKIFESAQETLRKDVEHEGREINHEPVPELPQIVSATLAEIYVRQGEFEEAIKTYRALIQLRPKQKEIFEKKIEELEKKLKSLS